MEPILTAKIPLYPTLERSVLLVETLEPYRQGCKGASDPGDATHCLQQAILHNDTYHPLRTHFGLRSPMAQSVIKTVISRYNSVWIRVQFTKPALDLIWNCACSLKAGQFSINTLMGRVPVLFARHRMETFFDGALPRTKDETAADWAEIRQVVGFDFGTNFLLTAYDSPEQTTFFPGRAVKVRHAPFARRWLKRLDPRESRWMTDVNHQVSTALVVRHGAETLFVLEDLVRRRCDPMLRKETASALVCISGKSQAPAFSPGLLTREMRKRKEG